MMRLGEFLIFVGVFVLSLQWNWEALMPLELANFVIAGGVVLLVCFGLALWSRSRVFAELIHLVATAVGAVLLGMIASSLHAVDWADFDFAGPLRAEKTFNFDGTFSSEVAAPSITLQLAHGDTIMQTWDRETFQMVILARVRGWSLRWAEEALEEIQIHPEISPTGIVFTAPRTARGFNRIEIDVELYLPRLRSYEFLITTTNGRVEITSVAATQAQLASTNGRIVLQDFTAQKVTLKTTNGRISGQLASGEAQATATNGEIDLTLDALAGSYLLSALNGRIRLDVPSDLHTDVGYSISARSTNGRVNVELADFVFSQQERRSVEGTTKNFSTATAKITIQASTTNGSIYIR